MAQNKDIITQLKDVLQESAKVLQLSDYSLNLNVNVIIGDGFLGEFYKPSITDKASQTTHFLAVKKAPEDEHRRQNSSIAEVYENEIFFYNEVLPSLRRFEEEHQVSKRFNEVPEFLNSKSEKGKEIIVFKDITKIGFELREKDLLIDDAHARLIFQTYGHFHALSFCLKQLQPEEYKRLTKPLHCMWKMMNKTKMFQTVISEVQQKVYECLDEVDDIRVKEAFKKYVDNTAEIFSESCIYKGQYSGIVHGDCWSNNMMFKYKDDSNHNVLESMKLLDFQLICDNSPIHDLSYFFYTGGSKELFDKLEDYLDVYHANFVKIAEQFNCNGHDLLPREILSQEWRQYAKFGMILSSMLTKVKLTSAQDTIEMIESSEKLVENERLFLEIPYDEKAFEERVRNVVVHMFEIGAL